MINYNDFINNFYNIQLVFLGISISVFTVMFAFIITKRDELKSLNSEIENGDNSPSVKQKRSFLISTIQKLIKINSYSIIVMITSFILFIISFYISFFNFKLFISNLVLIGLNLILLIEILLVFYLLFRVLKYYKKMSKI